MSVQKTTFRLWPEKDRGLHGLEIALEALSAILPYARIETVWLDHVAFPVDVDRFPAAIWQRLLADKTWHPKLVSHLSQSLAVPPVEKVAPGSEAAPGDAATQRAKRLTAIQARFFRLLPKPHIRVALGGTMLFDPESTPGMLSTVLIPKARAMGCRLSVDALAETLRQNQATPATLQIAMLQRIFYRDLETAAPH